MSRLLKPSRGDLKKLSAKQHNVLADFFEKRRNEVVGMILEYTADQECLIAKLLEENAKLKSEK